MILCWLHENFRVALNNHIDFVGVLSFQTEENLVLFFFFLHHSTPLATLYMSSSLSFPASASLLVFLHTHPCISVHLPPSTYSSSLRLRHPTLCLLHCSLPFLLSPLSSYLSPLPFLLFHWTFFFLFLFIPIYLSPTTYCVSYFPSSTSSFTILASTQ